MTEEDIIIKEENSLEYLEFIGKKPKKRSGWYDEHDELDHEDKNYDTRTDREQLYLSQTSGTTG